MLQFLEMFRASLQSLFNVVFFSDMVILVADFLNNRVIIISFYLFFLQSSMTKENLLTCVCTSQEVEFRVCCFMRLFQLSGSTGEHIFVHLCSLCIFSCY